jgi:hypothetical protein
MMKRLIQCTGHFGAKAGAQAQARLVHLIEQLLAGMPFQKPQFLY